MIVKQPSIERTPFLTRRFLLLVGGLLLMALLGLAFKYLVIFAPFSSQEVIFCGAEEVKFIEGTSVFTHNGKKFGGGHTQSNEKAHSGEYASLLRGEEKSALLHEFEGAKPNDIYRASVWRYGHKLAYSYLIASAGGPEKMYRQTGSAIAIDEEGWEKLELYFSVPNGYQDLRIYVTKASQEDVFFDDLLIEKLDKRQVMNLSRQDSLFPSLDLLLDRNAVSTIAQKRDQAIAKGILFSQEDDWVKGDLNTGTDRIPVKARLKGDWMDHLSGEKWSFRISTRKGNSWNRLMTFSVQNPETRNHLSEWVYHQMLEREDVLTTRYDFLHFSLNGQSKGVYAFEEHFEKQLPEYKHRREGPILKFAEEGIWQARKRQVDFEATDLGIENRLNSFEASEIKPFKEGKTAGDSALAGQFELAQSLMQQYKLGNRPAAEVFDLDRMARHLAIADVNRAYHNMVWHNQRFYYNPVLSRLEPIGFDGFTEQGVYKLRDKAFLGAEISRRSGNAISDLLYNLMLDSDFIEKYLFHLHRFTSPGYLESFQLEIEKPLKLREEFIKTEWPNYSYKFKPLDYAREVRNLMFPLNESSVRAFTQKKEEETTSLSLINYHILPLKVLGFGTQPSKINFPLEQPILLPSHNKTAPPVIEEITVPESPKYIFYALPGIDSVFHSAISVWPLPVASVPAQDLFGASKIVSNSLYRLIGKTLVFARGKHLLDSALVIPKGFQVRFEAGCELQIEKGGFFLSRSPVFLLGSEEDPILIYSKDGSANGFTVLQAGARSVMDHVRFEGLNTLSQAGWKLTGAVTFYESDVDIMHCTFTGNHCEDGLNLVRCNFEMDRCVVSETYADGFDADFCVGNINNCLFSKTGNDCLDFSGSRITIRDCLIKKAGDKGISVGEEAQVKVVSVEIDEAITGVASKDLSRLTIDRIILKNCEKGFTAYQKKPEYGGASILVKYYEVDKVKYLHLIEKGSSLILDGQEVGGI